MNEEENKEKLNRQIENFISTLNPFGWLDIKAGIDIYNEIGIERPEEALSEALDEFKSSTGVEDNNKIDITYIAYDDILQKVRNIIDKYLDFDINNDVSFYTAGNYCGTGWDFSDGDKEKLQERLLKEYKEDKSSLSDCLSDENDLVKKWLEYNDLMPEEIKFEVEE